MNIDNILDLARRLERMDTPEGIDGFNMEVLRAANTAAWVNPKTSDKHADNFCGTAGCIAGWAVSLSSQNEAFEGT